MNKIFSLFLISFTLLAHNEEDPFNAFIHIDPFNSKLLVNIGIKDNIDVKGMITSAGSLALSNNYPNKDAFLISKLKLSNYHIYGKTNLSVSEDTLKRYNSYGWNTYEIDGHDHEAISNAITEAKAKKKERGKIRSQIGVKFQGRGLPWKVARPKLGTIVVVKTNTRQRFQLNNSCS